jgi:capsular polysaccharide biosynthesis protein
MSVAQGLVEIYQIMLESEEFLKEVVGELTDNPDYAEYKSITNGITINAIKNMMTVSQRDETSVFSISVTATSPELACVVLNAVYDKATVKIPDLVPNTFKLSEFKKPTDPADSKSIAPNSKHEVRNAVLAFLVAAVVSVVAIWVYSFFDVVIRDRKKLADNVDIPILGVIPRHELPTMQKGDAGDA